MSAPTCSLPVHRFDRPWLTAELRKFGYQGPEITHIVANPRELCLGGFYFDARAGNLERPGLRRYLSPDGDLGDFLRDWFNTCRKEMEDVHMA